MDQFHKFVKAPRNMAAGHNRSALTIESKCESMPSSTNDEVELMVGMYISAAILRAFSIELSLKALHYCLSSQRPPRAHTLESLFDNLTDTAAKQRIEDGFKNPVSQRSFRDVLHEISRLFIDWRYLHEQLGQNATLGFDSDEMSALLNAVFSELDRQIAQRQ